MLLTHSSVMESLGQPLHPWGLMGSTSLKPLHISAAGFTRLPFFITSEVEICHPLFLLT